MKHFWLVEQKNVIEWQVFLKQYRAKFKAEGERRAAEKRKNLEAKALPVLWKRHGGDGLFEGITIEVVLAKMAGMTNQQLRNLVKPKTKKKPNYDFYAKFGYEKKAQPVKKQISGITHDDLNNSIFPEYMWAEFLHKAIQEKPTKRLNEKMLSLLAIKGGNYGKTFFEALKKEYEFIFEINDYNYDNLIKYKKYA